MQIPHDAGTEKKVSRALLRDYFAPLKVCIAIIFPALDAHQFSVAPRQFLGKLQGIETHRLQLMNGQIGAATAVRDFEDLRSRAASAPQAKPVRQSREGRLSTAAHAPAEFQTQKSIQPQPSNRTRCAPPSTRPVTCSNSSRARCRHRCD